MRKLNLAVMSLVILSGCASLGVNVPKATISTNIPFFYRSTLAMYNSAGPGITTVPQIQGQTLTVKRREGKKKWAEDLQLSYGNSATVNLGRNTNGRGSVAVSFAVKVYERGRFIGTYHDCLYVPADRDENFVFDFDRRKLQDLKTGRYTGYQCNGGFHWY